MLLSAIRRLLSEKQGPGTWENAQIAEKDCWLALWEPSTSEARRRVIFSERIKGEFLISQLELYLGQEIETLCKGKRILDVACGPVSYTSSMKGASAIEGVDPLHYPDWVYEKYGNRCFAVHRCRLEDMPDRKYDIALCYNALQHFESLQTACAALRRLLDREGRCLIIDYLEIPCDAAHLQYLTKEGLDKTFSDNGFRVNSVEKLIRLDHYVERPGGEPIKVYMGDITAVS